jgi:hypothetical protein
MMIMMMISDTFFLVDCRTSISVQGGKRGKAYVGMPRCEYHQRQSKTLASNWNLFLFLRRNSRNRNRTDLCPFLLLTRHTLSEDYSMTYCTPWVHTAVTQNPLTLPGQVETPSTDSNYELYNLLTSLRTRDAKWLEKEYAQYRQYSGSDTVQSGRNSLTFRKNVLPLPLRPQSKPSNKNCYSAYSSPLKMETVRSSKRR